MTFKNPNASNASTSTLGAPEIRCDNTVPGERFPGCVNAVASGRIIYDGNSYIEFGRHLTSAQNSGLPGAAGTPPLHRITDAATIRRNRAVACPSKYPRPTGKSCDEYPFASTREGAGTGGGTARTFDYCLVTLANPSSTGPTGFSVCMIDENENSSAGSALQSALLVPFRIIDGDAYFVDVQY